MVLVQVHECLTTQEKRAKSVSQAKSTGPLLQRHSLNMLRYIRQELFLRKPPTQSVLQISIGFLHSRICLHFLGIEIHCALRNTTNGQLSIDCHKFCNRAQASYNMYLRQNVFLFRFVVTSQRSVQTIPCSENKILPVRACKVIISTYWVGM